MQGSVEQSLTDADDEQLAQARRDVDLFAGGLAQFGATLRVTGAPPILGWIWELINIDDPADAAFVVLALLSARRALGDTPLNVLGRTFASERQRFAAVQALLTAEPALQPYFHPDLGSERFAQASADERARISALLRQQMDAHPEWANALGVTSDLNNSSDAHE